jgi:HPt (histidine-containing phosphotransfer) domain-containing protein
MNQGDEELERALAKLRAKYLADLPQRLSDLRAELAKAEAGDHSALETVRLLVHRLAGSAGTHGFDQATARARAAESVAAQVCESGLALTSEQARELRGHIRDLTTAFGFPSEA